MDTLDYAFIGSLAVMILNMNLVALTHKLRNSIIFSNDKWKKKRRLIFKSSKQLFTFPIYNIIAIYIAKLLGLSEELIFAPFLIFVVMISYMSYLYIQYINMHMAHLNSKVRKKD